ncbi:Hypothetical predicted protein [Prunus dulcis]|uniref:Uncharacterized protein n=1 Tax=Prunus dulcis TaxID=3755 RepID=A0A5E4G6Q7_PRUDU|nr:uncharacterized protein LOC117612452 [Prunus dulcis]VVA35457.1 Hypothetical predicted protein [Prunus dulcis]
MEMTTRSRIRPRTNDPDITQPLRTTENTDPSLSVEENEIFSERSTRVGFFNFFNGFSQMLTGRVRILKNKIYALESQVVGVGNFGNNYFNGRFKFLLVLAFVLLLGLAYYRTSTTSEMSRLTILINYGGRWVDSRYENFKAKAVLVSNTITLKELQKQVYDIVNVDPNGYEITIKAMYKTIDGAEPAEIENDDDVEAFILASRSNPYKIPLCITLEETNLERSLQAP